MLNTEKLYSLLKVIDITSFDVHIDIIKLPLFLGEFMSNLIIMKFLNCSDNYTIYLYQPIVRKLKYIINNYHVNKLLVDDISKYLIPIEDDNYCKYKIINPIHNNVSHDLYLFYKIYAMTFTNVYKYQTYLYRKYYKTTLPKEPKDTYIIIFIKHDEEYYCININGVFYSIYSVQGIRKINEDIVKQIYFLDLILLNDITKNIFNILYGIIPQKQVLV